MAEEEVGLRLSLKNRRETAAGIHDVGDELDRAGDQAAQAGRQARSSSRGFAAMGKAGRLAGTGVRLGFAGVLATGYAATRLLQSSFAEAREAQKVARTTAQIVKTTGGVANVSARYLGRYAGRLSEIVGVDDELIQSSGNLLLTFKQVRNEQGKGNKVFDQALGLALDLSAAGFGSVEGGAKMLGKALNDPIKGISALGRAGLTFTEDQKATIKSMVESNRLLDAQKIILGEVRSQVGGVAREQATFGDRAGVVWGNLQERLGTGLLPLLNRFQRWFVREGGPALDGYLDLFERRGIPALRRFGGRARDLGEEYLPKVKQTLADVRDVLEPAAGFAGDMVDALTNMPPWARKAIVGGGLAAYAGNKLGLGKLLTGGSGGSGGLLGMVSKAKPLPVFVVNNGAGLGTGGPGGKPGGGLGSKILKFGGPALAYAGAAAANERFPGAMPFGDKGWLPGAPKEGEGWLSWFGGDPDKAAGRVRRFGDVSVEAADRMASAFGELPPRVQTAFVTRGVPESRRDVQDLARTYGLTKDQRRTLFEALGIPQAKGSTSELIHLYDVAGRPVLTRVDADTSSAMTKLYAVRDLLGSINSTPAMPPGYGGPGQGQGVLLPGSNPQNGRRGPRVPAAPKADTSGTTALLDDDWGPLLEKGVGATTAEPVVVKVNVDAREVGQAAFDYADARRARG